MYRVLSEGVPLYYQYERWTSSLLPYHIDMEYMTRETHACRVLFGLATAERHFTVHM